MANVRDRCEQPTQLKLLAFTIASYGDGNGHCWPSNDTLAKDMRVSISTLKRLLRTLVNAGEVDVLSSGRGRNQQRVLRLTRYAEPLNGSASPADLNRLNGSTPVGKPARNIHDEQPARFSLRSKRTHAAACSVLANAFEGLSLDNQEIIDTYNETFVPKGWRRLDKSTAAVAEALEYFAGFDWRKLFNDVANDPPDKWPKMRTLVRLRWHHY